MRWLSACLLLPALLLPPVTVARLADVRVLVTREVSVTSPVFTDAPAGATHPSPTGSAVHVVRVDARR